MRCATNLLVGCEIQRDMLVGSLERVVSALFQQRNSRITVPFGDSVVQRRIALAIRRVERAHILQEELYHGHGADSSSTMDGILPALVADARGSGWFGSEEEVGDVEVLLGCYEMKRGL